MVIDKLICCSNSLYCINLINGWAIKYHVYDVFWFKTSKNCLVKVIIIFYITLS
jgi:hypothetical protein